MSGRVVEKPAYEIRASVPLSYEAAVARAREELQKEGFGVLTEIDVRETLKKKLQLDFRKYVILGACNPPLAHRALAADPSIGLLHPGNVIVYEERPGQSVVAAFDPTAVKAFGPAPAEIEAVAGEVREKLARVVAGVAGRV